MKKGSGGRVEMVVNIKREALRGEVMMMREKK